MIAASCDFFQKAKLLQTEDVKQLTGAETILIVEDEAQILDLCQEILESNGYSVIIAHRGVLAEGAHFIQKPFSLDGLAGKVREVLDAHFFSRKDANNLLDDTIND